MVQWSFVCGLLPLGPQKRWRRERSQGVVSVLNVRCTTKAYPFLLRVLRRHYVNTSALLFSTWLIQKNNHEKDKPSKKLKTILFYFYWLSYSLPLLSWAVSCVLNVVSTVTAAVVPPGFRRRLAVVSVQRGHCSLGLSRLFVALLFQLILF